MLDTNESRKSAGLSSQQVLALLLGGTLGITAVVAGKFLLMRRAAVPELDPQAFAAAEVQWDSVAPPSYSIQTKVEGLQPATYSVEVQDGVVVSATRNGNPLRDPRTLGTWSVPGMFGTMEFDVNANADAEPGQEPLQLRARFHPEYGYPQRYVRLAWGTKVTTSWEVQRFVVRADDVTKDASTAQ